MKPPMLTVRQVATRLNCSEEYARRLMSSGRIRAAKVGRWRADESDVEAFIESRRPPQPTTPVIETYVSRPDNPFL